MTWEAIGTELGIAPTTAYRSAMRGMAAVPTEGQQEAKRAELRKLDRIERHLLSVMEREHITVNQGRVIRIGGEPIWENGKIAYWEGGTPVLDDGPGVQAAGKLLQVQERRARLLGLDAPTQARIEVVTEDVVDAEIRRLEEKLGEECQPVRQSS